MRPIKETIPLEDARAIIDATSPPIERTERVPITAANLRVLAREVIAGQDVPPFARAAMDGYAVVAADTFGAGQYAAKVLTCVEKVYTGEVPTRSIASGQCIEIATGAPLPDGADAVVMVEETEREDERHEDTREQPRRHEDTRNQPQRHEDANDARVRIFSPVYPGQNVGRRAADIAAGQVLLSPGDVLNPSRIGSIAAIGVNEVDVYERPRLAILSTGNEVIDPGQPLAPGQIYDINKFTLTAIIEEHGGVAVRYPTAADTIEDLDRALEACGREDVIIFSGGSSVGERDLVLDLLVGKGEVLIHGIAVKPGKPTLFGTIYGKPVFGMPGYPTSCLSNAYMLLVPFLRRLARLPPAMHRIVQAPLGQRIVSTTGRHQFYTVRLVEGVAIPAFKASGDITSMSRADGYVEIAAHKDIVEKGEIVDVVLF